MLEWVVETQGYTVTELDTVGASDAELEQRIVDYLREHPGRRRTGRLGGRQGHERAASESCSTASDSTPSRARAARSSGIWPLTARTPGTARPADRCSQTTFLNARAVEYIDRQSGG